MMELSWPTGKILSALSYAHVGASRWNTPKSYGPGLIDRHERSLLEKAIEGPANVLGWLVREQTLGNLAVSDPNHEALQVLHLGVPCTRRLGDRKGEGVPLLGGRGSVP